MDSLLGGKNASPMQRKRLRVEALVRTAVVLLAAARDARHARHRTCRRDSSPRRVLGQCHRGSAPPLRREGLEPEMEADLLLVPRYDGLALGIRLNRRGRNGECAGDKGQHIGEQFQRRSLSSRG